MTLAVARLLALSPAAAHGAPGPGDEPVPIGEPDEDEGYGDDDEDDDDEEDDDEEPMQLGAPQVRAQAPAMTAAGRCRYPA